MCKKSYLYLVPSPIRGTRDILRYHEVWTWAGMKCVSSWSKGKPLLWTPFIQRPLHKRKGGQVRFSNDQTIELEKKFETQKYLSPPERKRLAKMLQLSERQVSPVFRTQRCAAGGLTATGSATARVRKTMCGLFVFTLILPLSMLVVWNFLEYVSQGSSALFSDSTSVIKWCVLSGTNSLFRASM